MSSKDSVAKTIMVAAGLCIVCSILVSTAAVSLKPIQERNKSLDKKKNILMAAGLYSEGENIEAVFAERIKPMLVELSTGEYSDAFVPEEYDESKAIKDSSLRVEIAPEQDIASIRVRSKYAVIYEVMDGDSLSQVVLPIRGKGLWSTLYGFISVRADANTIAGLGFYQHGETPGLGGEVDNPKWKSSWRGKKIHDDKWDVAIKVIKGPVNTSRPGAEYQIDGLSGATITARGVSHLVQYWMGDEAFGPYLNKLKERGGNE